MFILYLHPVRPSQSPLIYGCVILLAGSDMRFQRLLKGMPSAFKQVFRYKDMCFIWKCKSFLPRLQKIKICFLSVSAKTFLQPINLHTSAVGTFFILVVSESLFAVCGYLFAPCGRLSAVRGFVFARCEQRFIQTENKFTVGYSRFYSMDTRCFFYRVGCPIQRSLSGSCLFLSF